MNEMTPFNFEGNQVRTIERENIIWFAMPDISKSLGLSNSSVAIKSLDDDEVTKFNLGGLSGNTNFISEPGLYKLIGASRKPEAKRFNRWVTHDVLPSIRKTGTYSTDNTLTAQRTKRLEIMEANKQTRKATALYDIAMEVSDEYAKQRMLNEAATLITGHDMRFDDQDYSGYAAQYIGDMLGISKGLVGRIANQLNIKAPKGGSNKYGHWVIRHTTTGTYSQWLYTDDGATEVATELRARIEQTA
ncbi:BRO-N domain-containing protein [Levilactobacillus brevis]|uniref:BRO-N domain-containing protein n=1 Tax=Levilactobacillus brevis TaxID=1580 RepID=UPI000572F5B7|nr:BRO family protein [Levilactobacillus brevis]AJA81629.1 hypothetical protein L747_00855 [Levilactobacillus brevis BSO 464]